ncbi:MAG: M4 family metallopeptidase [Rhizonema sp. PD37]|nr:M4 family metallopeptidase [Rhizonema sp. PD37]
MARKKKKSIRLNSQHPRQICPICCVLPPHMLEHIAQNGNPSQRDWAFQTLEVSAQFRGRREVVANFTTIMAQPGEKRRSVYDAKNGSTLPGVLVRSENEPPSSDPIVNEAYDGAGITYDFYHEVFDRNSVDNNGLRLDATVHYSTKYDNAFWNGTQMVYGDGDGELFQPFTKCIDVIAHELTHGVTQHQAALQYVGESGALNESFSDVFGSLVKQRVKKQTADQADWIIGEGIFTSKVKGVGIRSLKAPGTAYDDPVLGKDPQPTHVKDLYTGTKDHGGVHINSSIPSHAFYQSAMDIGGFAWEKTGKIWYITLCDRLDSKANFKQAAQATIKVAGELYGEASSEQKAVQSAWQKVGVS